MPGARTSKWRMHHVLKDGRGLEAPKVHLRTLRGLRHDKWGIEVILAFIDIFNALPLVDQLDATITMKVEMAWGRQQTIEYTHARATLGALRAFGRLLLQAHTARE